MRVPRGPSDQTPSGDTPEAGTGTSRRGEDGGAAERLLPLVYEELRRLAHRRLSKEPPGPTLDTTGLVHDAYVPPGTRAPRSIPHPGRCLRTTFLG